MSFLVAVAPPDPPDPRGPLLRSLIRDGPRGEWGTSWKAGDSLAPLGFSVNDPGSAAGAATWTSLFLGGGGTKVENEDDEDISNSSGEEEGRREGQWQSVQLHTVECEVPVNVWPGATLFRPVESYFST